MAEGCLYCEKCGEDIHIVPDFEPELERNMEQTIHTILEGLHEDQEVEQNSQEQKPENKTDRAQGNQQHKCRKEAGGGNRHCRRGRKRKKAHWVIPLFVFLLLLVTGGTVGFLYGYHSEKYQVNRALHYVAAGKYDKAIACYNRAIELDQNNIELIFSLAEVYYLKNNKIEYEYLLREIIKNPDASLEQLEGAYDKLIAIYRAREDYQTINDLLLGSGNENLISTYQSYIAREPDFSIKEGYYTSIKPLKLTAVGNGKIYYTMDGTQPTENSAQYTAPIILENGDYVIKAFFVNEKGIASDVVSKEYHIKNDEIPPPEVSILSGDYNFPVNIEITSDNEDVYYTTDGTIPTYFSNVYTGPIPMPLGRSNYKFAKILDGVTGTVVERTYNLVLNTDFTPEQAVASVVQYSMDTGKIQDENGYFDDSGASYCYEYQYVTNINYVDDFYVIAEIIRGADGSLTKTGNHFAVNVYTRELYKLQQDSHNRWSLIEVEKTEMESE